jgi:hypothetical protein
MRTDTIEHAVDAMKGEENSGDKILAANKKWEQT